MEKTASEEIDRLTPEQEALIPVYVKKYTDKFFNYNPIDKEKATEFFQWVYKFSGLSPFKELYVVNDPDSAQALANRLCETEGVHYSYSGYGNAWDLGWLAFYSFMKEVCGVKLDENFDHYHQIVDLNIYDCIQFDDAVIVMELATNIKRKGIRLHCEDGPAICFGPGYQLYFWNGVAVPEKLIMQRDQITKEDILGQTNAEIRRCFYEVLGGQEYYNISTDGNGVDLIDEDMDDQGFMMQLYRTKEPDPIINAHVVFLECICPSTGRSYNIPPPDQNVTNVWAAKASLANYEKVQIRHGDVYFKNLDVDFEKPIFES